MKASACRWLTAFRPRRGPRRGRGPRFPRGVSRARTKRRGCRSSRAPADTSRHLLEVYTPGDRAAALDRGAHRTAHEHGFPLRLSMLAEDAVESMRGAAVSTWPSTSRWRSTAVRRRPPKGPPRDPLIGRALAGGKLDDRVAHRHGHAWAPSTRRAIASCRMPVAVKVLHESFQQRRRLLPPLLRRGARREPPRSPEPHARPRLRPGAGRPALPRDGVPRRRELRAVARARSALLAATRIAEIMMQVCAGLAHAHARGIVHRDIKPDNIVLVRVRTTTASRIELVKVCDFGIALLRASGRRSASASPARPSTCRPSSAAATSSTRAATSTRAASCSTSSRRARCRSSPTSPSSSSTGISRCRRRRSRRPPDVDPRLERIVQKALRSCARSATTSRALAARSEGAARPPRDRLRSRGRGVDGREPARMPARRVARRPSAPSGTVDAAAAASIAGRPSKAARRRVVRGHAGQLLELLAGHGDR